MVEKNGEDVDWLHDPFDSQLMYDCADGKPPISSLQMVHLIVNLFNLLALRKLLMYSSVQNKKVMEQAILEMIQQLEMKVMSLVQVICKEIEQARQEQ